MKWWNEVRYQLHHADCSRWKLHLSISSYRCANPRVVLGAVRRAVWSCLHADCCAGWPSTAFMWLLVQVEVLQSGVGWKLVKWSNLTLCEIEGEVWHGLGLANKCLSITCLLLKRVKTLENKGTLDGSCLDCTLTAALFWGEVRHVHEQQEKHEKTWKRWVSLGVMIRGGIPGCLSILLDGDGNFTALVQVKPLAS